MNAILFFLIIFAVLFVLCFFMRRRFGVLGLALAAGVIISQSWAEKLTPIIQQQGIDSMAPPLLVIVQAALVITPAVLLLFSGPTYHQKTSRIIGSLLFALLASAFLLSILGGFMQFDEVSLPIYEAFTEFQQVIIVTCLVVAIIDVLMTQTPRKKRGRKAGH